MISYVKGDATRPQAPAGLRPVIVHVGNDLGAWGAGFTAALSRRWPDLGDQYRQFIRHGGKLGDTLVVQPERGLLVATLVAQRGLRSRNNPRPIHYPALKQSLSWLAGAIDQSTHSFHLPRIGCGLAGGTWAAVEPILQATLGEAAMTVYDL